MGESGQQKKDICISIFLMIVQSIGPIHRFLAILGWYKGPLIGRAMAGNCRKMGVSRKMVITQSKMRESGQKKKDICS